jgi:hypothetical protein
MLTIIPGEVAPVDHKYDEPAVEDKVTFPPSQKVVGPLAEIIGVAGNGCTVTWVVSVTIQPVAAVTVTV